MVSYICHTDMTYKLIDEQLHCLSALRSSGCKTVYTTLKVFPVGDMLLSWPPSELALEAKPVSVKLFLQMAQYTASLFHGMAKDGDEGPFPVGSVGSGA